MRLTDSTKSVFCARLNALTPQSQPQFGKLNTAGMVVHMRIVLELSLGEIVEPDHSTFFSRTVVRFLVYNVVPWPKGKVKVPEQFTPPPRGDLDAERRALLATIGRFLAAEQREPGRKTLHPMFGPMTLNYWQKAHGMHFDHHLKQFGV